MVSGALMKAPFERLPVFLSRSIAKNHPVDAVNPALARNFPLMGSVLPGKMGRRFMFADHFIPRHKAPRRRSDEERHEAMVGLLVIGAILFVLGAGIWEIAGAVSDRAGPQQILRLTRNIVSDWNGLGQ